MNKLELIINELYKNLQLNEFCGTFNCK